MMINNHSVLLKGVNDNLGTMRSLLRGLLRIKVRPYYLFHCDPVTGAGHFRTSVWKGMEIMEGLRGHMSGIGIPTYVVDSPHGGGKIPLMPNYLISMNNDAVILRNFEGQIVRYQAEDKPSSPQSETPTRGVSALLEGHTSVIVPEGNDRLARRRKNRKSRAKTCGSEAPAAASSTTAPAAVTKNGKPLITLPTVVAPVVAPVATPMPTAPGVSRAMAGGQRSS
jgi:lysine 2,3-aminomutase